MEPEVLTPNEVAALVRCDPETVTAALRRGELKGYQRMKRGRWRIRRADALAWAFGEMEEAA